MAKKRDSWDIANKKGREIIKTKKMIEKEAEEEKTRERIKEKRSRKMIRISEEHHEKAKFNDKKMQLQKYIER